MIAMKAFFMDKQILVSQVIPACEGRAFTLKKGQILRVTDIEGEQVGDMVCFNLADLRERFSAWVTTAFNRSMRRFTTLYSGPPRSNPMFSVVEDTVGIHWCGGRCNKAWYKFFFNVDEHLNCQDILADCIKDYGLTDFDVPDVFNFFMNVTIKENGDRQYAAPLSRPGDYTSMRAEMDCLVAIAACPEDLSPVNKFKPKPLQIEIFG